MSECTGISSTELLRRTGITYRQLDHWCRIGYVEPHNHRGRENGNPGSGYFRCWAQHEVAKVYWFVYLTRWGLDYEVAWGLLQNPDRIAKWIDGFAAMHYQLTGKSILWEIYDAQPVEVTV